MAMNQPFTTASPTLVNYDWTDLSGGTGYIRFYGCETTTSTATDYFLTRQVVDSYPNKSQDYNGGSGADIDFDIEFKDTNTIKGTAIFNITRQIATAGASVNQTLVITIYHVAPDTTETSLGSVTATTRTDSGVGIYRENLTIELAEKVFTFGDKLRVNVVLTKNLANVGYIFHDPASGISLTDDLTRTVGTDFTCDIPFKINR